VLRTLVGKGGVSGVPGDTGGQKFVVDFAGGLLTELAPDADIRPVVTVQRGELTEAVLSRIDGTNVWRLVAEVRGEAGRSVELSARIEGYDQVLTETWLYQWVVE